MLDGVSPCLLRAMRSGSPGSTQVQRDASMRESEGPIQESLLQPPSKMLTSSTMSLFSVVLHALFLSFVNYLAEAMNSQCFVCPTTSYGKDERKLRWVIKEC